MPNDKPGQAAILVIAAPKGNEDRVALPGISPKKKSELPALPESMDEDKCEYCEGEGCEHCESNDEEPSAEMDHNSQMGIIKKLVKMLDTDQE